MYQYHNFILTFINLLTTIYIVYIYYRAVVLWLMKSYYYFYVMLSFQDSCLEHNCWCGGAPNHLIMPGLPNTTKAIKPAESSIITTGSHSQLRLV